nr:cysteine-rich receptor-like protein kinase 25 [Quercus suber]
MFSFHKSSAFLFLSLVVFALTSYINSQPEPIYNYHYCSVGLGSLEQANDDYLSNLTVLLDSLSSKASQNYSFYKAISNNTGIYGLFLCRGDVSQYTCQTCVSYVSNYIKTRCPGTSAIAWYNECMLRYSDINFFGVPQTEPHVFMWNAQNNITAPEEPNFGALGLVNNLTDKVLATEMLFEAGNMSVGNGNGFRYGLVQCTRDINSTQCGNCLKILIEKVQDCCQARTEFGIISPSCFLRYANYSLIQEASAPVLPPLPSPLLPSLPPSPLPGTGRNTTQIAIIATTVIILILVICLCILLKVRKRKSKEYFQVLDVKSLQKKDVKSLQFDFGTIIIATNNFSEANKLGKGGFGAVYKGKLSNGQEIAVKRLSMNSSQGDLEFKNEVDLVAKLQHRNLIRLLGFCLERNEKLLIYEFVPNISLDHFIYDPTKRAQLGSTNRIVGTYGYMAPEYAMSGQFSVKSDVFSFGVLILEIVSGRKVTCIDNGENREHLLSYAWKNWMEGTATNLIDPTLRDSPITEIMRCIHTGLLCVQTHAVARPNMTSVVAMINSDSITLPVPTRPSYFTQSDVVLDTPLQQDIGSHVTKYWALCAEVFSQNCPVNTCGQWSADL